MNQQESIQRILREIRVPRSERVELYKDDNIIVVVPLTHRALKKYAHECQWCINSDLGEWEDYHQGKHAVIIQRNPKKPKIGITGNPTASEIFFLAKWDNNASSFDDVCHMLDYEFRNDRTMSDYYVTISNDIDNFATNIVYYSPENGIYDQEDNFLWNFNYEITDIPNVIPEVIKIMDDYLQEEKEMSLQESVQRILREGISDHTKNILNNKIKTIGVVETSKLVNGVKTLVKILELDLNDIETQEMLVKNFIYFLDTGEDVDVDFLLIKERGVNQKIIKIHATTTDYENNPYWYANFVALKADEFFPFHVGSVFNNTSKLYDVKIFIDAKITNPETEIQESIKRILKEETSNRTQNKLIDMINNTGPLNTIRATGGYMNFKKLYGDDIPKEIRKKIILNFVKKYGDNKNVINTIGDDMFIDVEPLRKNTVNYTTMVKQIYLMGHIVFEQKPKQKSLKAPQVGYLDIIELSDFDLDMIINNLYNRFT